MPFDYRLGDALGKSNVGCLGAMALVVLTAGGALGLVVLAWWVVMRSLGHW